MSKSPKKEKVVVPEEELLKRTLPDYLAEDLDFIFIGINPGLNAARTGKYYAGPGNHFWKCMHWADILPELSSVDDYRLTEFGIGVTNIVERTTRGLSDLSKAEIKEGAVILKEKLVKFKPKLAVFNGKEIFKLFTGIKVFNFGLQPGHLEDCSEVRLFVMPSSSARCTQLPRAQDKIPYFAALKKSVDHLRGRLPQLNIEDVSFPSCLPTAPRKSPEKKKETTPRKRKGEAVVESPIKVEKSEEIGFFGIGC